MKSFRPTPFSAASAVTRSAAALFVHFLQRNGMLIDANGESRVSNNALAAITLMVAMSDPKEKELMIALIASMLSGEGE
ncbi:hypothetical protein [Microcella alkaliphila]|uniref:hypothetical protein n=1 Tax=Microcella alkaliphila TaxID=279828 RepID=UPI001F541338|nr:hypothetical protein [Microcella alkaliphila]